jgi:hypothetical protein
LTSMWGPVSIELSRAGAAAMKTKPVANCHECEAVFTSVPEGFTVEFIARSTGISVGICQECQEDRS